MMEGTELVGSPSGSPKDRRTGDDGPKFYQTFSHGQFLEEDTRHSESEEHMTSAVKTWKKLVYLACTGVKRFPGSSYVFRHFFAHNIKLRAPVISGSGAQIAVLHESTVTFFTQIDDYKRPVGSFAAASQAEVLLHGGWIDEWQMFVVASSSHVIYFLDSKARELSKIIVSDEGEHIVGLVIVRVHGTSTRFQRYGVVILTSKGTLQRYEVDKDTIPLLPVHHAADASWDVSDPHPWGVWSLSFHPEQSTMVVAGPARGSDAQPDVGFDAADFTLSLWRLSGSPLSLDLQYGSSIPRGLSQWITWPSRWSSPHMLATPKVALSPNLQFVAVLHPTGKLHIKRLKRTADWILEDVATVQKDVNSQEKTDDTNQEPAEKYLSLLSHGVEDFSWWNEDTLIVANRRSGSLDLLQLPCLKQLWAESAPALSSPVRLTQVLMGRVFFVQLLSCQIGAKQFTATGVHEKGSFLMRFSTLYPKVLLAAFREALSDFSRSGWRLMSLVEKSEHEIYLILIEQGKYDLAVKMAEKYGLDTDEVYKAQWRRSDYGREALQRLFPTIKDLKWIVNESLNKIGSSTEAMNALLEYGLTVTQPFVHDEGQEHVDGVSDHVWWFSLKRLRLLQYKDRLDTFLAMHLGRFFREQYSLFRAAPLHNIAIKLAEEGKTGSLELVMKRHLYSLAPHLFAILDAIPETVPPHTYINLLPSIQVPAASFPRENADWVENKKILEAVNHGAGKQELLKNEVGFHECTEHMVMLSVGLVWPSEMEIIEWYRGRARGIDKASGQLENSLTLLNVGLEKGVNELDCLFEDVSDLYWLVFGTGDSEDAELDISLCEWEQLKDSDKFSYMLRGANSRNVIDKLRERGLPFMRRKCVRAAARKKALEENSTSNYFEKQSGALLGEWLRQAAEENRLDICAAVLSEGCKGLKRDWLFEDETELVTAALECVYSCKQTDQWPLLGAILQKLPRNKAPDKEHLLVVEEEQPSKGFRSGLASVFRHAGVTKSLTMLPLVESGPKLIGQDQVIAEDLDTRLRQAEGFVEVGRLLASYQVQVSMSSLLATDGDPNARKQYLRSLLARFSRRQPARADSEWVNLWHDFRILHEKAAFLDKEYLLAEFCRGLLKAGKLSLAKSYLKGNGSVVLSKEQVERIVLHAAREYFYSASSLDSLEVEIAKECLALVPDSESASAEANLFEAITHKLPFLGVTLLPMEFRQMTNRMEVIKRAISAHPDSYLNVQELISVTKLLGLTSQDDLAEVEIGIARKAFEAGDVELTRELCLEVVRKGYSPAWDLCSAIGRHSELDLNSRKEFLDFAVNHCDSAVRVELENLLADVIRSIENADREKDATSQMASLSAEETVPSTPILASSPPSSPRLHASTAADEDLPEPEKEPERGWAGPTKLPDPSSATGGTSAFWKRGREYLSKVTKVTHISSLYSSEVVARKKIIGFSCLELPWLVELGLDRSAVEEEFKDVGEDKWAEVTRATYLHANKVALSNFQEASGHSQTQKGHIVSLDDNVLLRLAREAFSPPASRVGDMVGCGYLLNLSDPHLGLPVFEQEWDNRSDHKEILQLMNTALIYCQLQDASVLEGASGTGSSINEPEGRNDDVTSSGFWKDWRLQIEAKMNLLKHAHVVKQIVPGAEMKRFAAGDHTYIKSVILTMVESLPGSQRNLLPKVLEVADFYAVSRSEVLLRFLFSLLLSDMVTEEDIKAEVSEQGDDLFSNPSELLQALIVNVYPRLDGVNKQRLAYFYGLLSDCCSAIRKQESGHPVLVGWQGSLEFESEFFRTVANECLLMDSVVPELNFKNVIGIDELDPMLATKEIFKYVDESNVRRFADLVTNLQPFVARKRNGVEGEFPSSQFIYLSLIKRLLGCFPVDSSEDATRPSSISDLDDAYSSCRMYLGYLAADQLKEVLQALMQGSISPSFIDAVEHEDMLVRKGGKLRESFLNRVILLWIQALQDVQMCLSYHENPSNPAFTVSLDEMLSCLKAFVKLVAEGRMKSKQGATVLDYYVKMVPFARNGHDILKFLKSMVLAGCLLQAVMVVLENLVSSSSNDLDTKELITSGSISSERSPVQDDQEGLRSSSVDEPIGEGIAPTNSRKIPDIVDVYLQLLDSALGVEQLHVNTSLPPQLEELKGIITSLSVLEHNTEEKRAAIQWPVAETLSKLRAEVWCQLWRSMKETDIDIHIRISLFELLEAIQGKKSDSSGDDADEPMILWEGWNGNKQEPLVAGNGGDVDLSMFMSVMRSTRILFRLWPGIQVTEQDIGTPEAAMSFFSRLDAGASSANHVLALKTLLEEWDGLFDGDVAESSMMQGSRKGTDGWDGWDEEDDWGEGWQDYSDAKENVTQSLKVHPLHSCWKLTLHKLFQHRCDREALQVLDSALANPSKVLLTEDEVKELVGKIGEKNALSALRMALLLPYDFSRSLALQLFAQDLESGDEDDHDGFDGEDSSPYESLLALVMSAEVLPSIAENPEMQNVFSSLVVTLRRLGQKLQQQRLQESRKGQKQNPEDLNYIPLYRVAFPLFVGELTAARQFEDAGALVLQYMRVPSARATKGAAVNALKSYLQAEITAEKGRARPSFQSGQGKGESRRFESYLRNTMQLLDRRLGDVLRKASDTASNDLR